MYMYDYNHTYMYMYMTTLPFFGMTGETPPDPLNFNRACIIELARSPPPPPPPPLVETGEGLICDWTV